MIHHLYLNKVEPDMTTRSLVSTSSIILVVFITADLEHLALASTSLSLVACITTFVPYIRTPRPRSRGLARWLRVTASKGVFSPSGIAVRRRV